ncbi:MAG TPA: L-aspartate oxidase [Bryobacteraceae bacterium]
MDYPHFLVIGAGVAGLRAAIELAEAGPVLVVAKDSLRESSSEYAQGGIAAALGEEDDTALHEQDTLYAGDGLCNPAAVHVLVEEGPAAIQELIEWGAEFDREGAGLALTREGAHSRNRILHAHGDSTGHEIARTLYRKAASLPSVSFRSFSASVDLLADGEVAGAVLYDATARSTVTVAARAVLLAAGGLGSVYLHTTNPEVATGDGVAMAFRAGAEIADMEFVQFHPTALAVEGAPRFLLSEALRGEGAYLRNVSGERFMERYHPLKELAPRDVVSRAIVAEMQRTGASHVLLDLAHRESGFARRRFPRIFETCKRYGVDLESNAAPVAPAAHYAMGGVRTGLDGRTSLPCLFAAGEAACTGVHGANRLASNSLLEGIVFGARAGRTMRNCAGAPPTAASSPPPIQPGNLRHAEIRRIAWDRCGILRDGAGLQEACAQLERGRGADAESENMRQAALLIARSALAREESRGAHFRTDFPERRAAFEKHSVVKKGGDVAFR